MSLKTEDQYIKCRIKNCCNVSDYTGWICSMCLEKSNPTEECVEYILRLQDTVKANSEITSGVVEEGKYKKCIYSNSNSKNCNKYGLPGKNICHNCFISKNND